MGEILDRAKLIIRTKLHSRRERSAFKPNRDQLGQVRETVADLNRVGVLNEHQASGLQDVIDDMTVKAPGVDIDGLTGIGSERIKLAKKVITSTDRPGLIDVDGLAAIEYSHDLAQKAETQARPEAQVHTDSPERAVSRRMFLAGLGGTAVLGLLYLVQSNSRKTDQVVAVSTRVPAIIPTVETKPIQVPIRLSGILGSEQDAWEKVLGTLIEIEPFPSSVTPEVKNNLEAFGFKLMYLPRLELGSLAELKSREARFYLDELQKRYPNWKHYETMSEVEKKDQSVPRNLVERFWRGVENNEFMFPKLGRWVAVENIPKPSQGEKYKITQLPSMLGFENRVGVSRVELSAAMDREKAGLITKMELKESDIRLPEPLEWNLMANREGWGATQTMELVNVTNNNTVWVGNSESGGAASFWVGMAPANTRNNSVGFRIVVVLSS